MMAVPPVWWRKSNIRDDDILTQTKEDRRGRGKERVG
jgi:hypothetical protein